MNARIAVIGSNSFSGASFIAHALQQGHELLGLSRSTQPADCFLPYTWLPATTQEHFRFVRADLNTELPALLRALDEFEPSIVVNFAAQGMVAQSWQRPLHWYQTNLLGNVALHEELRRRPWLKKYVHVSTPEVYGNTEGSIDENAPFNPSTPYAASRAACDLHLRTFLQNYGFPVVWTRAANVYGPGQQLYRIIPRGLLCVRTGERLMLHGGGVSVRSFIHIRDVAEATLRIAQESPLGETYHISTDRFVSIRELVTLLCQKAGVDFDSLVDVAPERPGKDAAYLLNCSKLRTRFSWSETVSLEEGINETLDWLDTRLPEILKQPRDYQHKQ